jgi:endonuclease YncB( thermonuclease family)
LAKIFKFGRGRFRQVQPRQGPGLFPIALLGVLLGIVGTTGYFKFAAAPIFNPLNVITPQTITSPYRSETIVGRASVIDGDTIEIHGTRIRLFGIDAPEGSQTCLEEGKPTRCGQYSALALADKIGSSPVMCEPKDRDRYNRVVAVCRSSGEDLNAWMVSQGMAVAYRQYSVDYVPQEEQAAALKRGIWKGDFIFPWDWRHQNENRSVRALPPSFKSAPTAGSPNAAQPNNATSDQCLIKGNISQSGERIYHVPGGAFYDRTVINEAQGERWFCSEAEAQAAGWRRSRR